LTRNPAGQVKEIDHGEKNQPRDQSDRSGEERAYHGQERILFGEYLAGDSAAILEQKS